MKTGYIYSLLVWLLSVSLMLSSCHKREEVKYVSGKTPLVELDGNVLYQEDLLQVLPVDISEADSGQFANR